MAESVGKSNFLYIKSNVHIAILIFGIAVPWLQNMSLGPAPNLSAELLAFAVLSALLLFNSCCIQTATLYGWIVASVVSATIGLSQYFGWSELGGNLIAEAPAGVAFANLRQRNLFASLISIGLATFILLFKNEQSKLNLNQPHSILGRCIHFGAIAVLAVALAASNSRTGSLQLLILMFLALYWNRKSWKLNAPLWVFVVLVYLCAAFELPQLSEMVTGHKSIGLIDRIRADVGCGSRSVLWSNVLHLIAQKPWFGWGWGEMDFAHFSTLYPGERFCDILDNAHNLPLHLAVELGVPIALMLCGVVGWLAWRAKPWAETHPTRQLAWAVLAVIGLHSMLEYPLWYGPFQLTVVLCVWMLYAIPAKHTEKRPVLALPFAIRTSAASVLLVVCAYAAWDYWRISQIYIAPEKRAAAYRTDTLAKIQSSWLFQNQVKFAELTITELTPANAERMYELALGLLHFSPEPRVVQKLIASATMLGKDTEAVYYLQRFKAAFPKEYAQWKK
jgi:O-antigen ligase